MTHKHLFVAACFLLAACGPAERQHLAEQCATLPDIAVGMTKEQVLASKWGEPSDINRDTSASGTTEFWHYDAGIMCSQSSDSASIMFNEQGRVAQFSSAPYKPWKAW